MNGQLDFDNIGNCNFEENQPKITAVKNNCGIKIDVADDLSLELEKSHYKDENEKTVEDYLYTDKNGDQWGIFKLTPRECGRLMNVSDDDIDKILSVNSNSQAYKQFGNSIVVSVLMAIFSQLNISGIKPWNDMTDDERYDLLTKGCVLGECVEEV